MLPLMAISESIHKVKMNEVNILFLLSMYICMYFNICCDA